MSAELPEFRKVNRSYASRFINDTLSGPRGSALRQFIEFDDCHYRVVFAANYFQLQEDQDQPSKSQWNTLKKKLKRRNRSIFVFRKHGEIACGKRQSGEQCLYLDFGFMLD